MITQWLAGLWAKFAGWLAVAGSLVLIGLYLFWRGKRDQKHEDAAAAAQGSLQALREVQADSSKAVDRVAQQAAQAPPPDTVKRDDFDATR